jgi:hypothetical protein
MASVKEKLRELVDRLSEEDAGEALAYISSSIQEQMEPEDDLDALIAQQGVKLLADPTHLAQGVWPEDENVDEFITALEAWRAEGRDG